MKCPSGYPMCFGSLCWKYLSGDCKGDKMDKVQIHEDIVKGMNNIYKCKNADYGDSFSETRAKYHNAILIRLTDKLSRLDRLLTGNDIEVKEESIEDTLTDLANYAIMELIEMRIEQGVYE